MLPRWSFAENIVAVAHDHADGPAPASTQSSIRDLGHVRACVTEAQKDVLCCGNSRPRSRSG